MSDLISRQALQDAMYHEAFETDSDMQKWDSGCWIRYKMFENVVEALPSAQQWIPVSERLPEKKTEVIYSLENHYVSTGYMTDRDYEGNIVELHWEDMESGVLIYPEAWMPLPEPYKERREEHD